VPGVLKAMGKETLTARVEEQGWKSRIFDAALRVLPTEDSCPSRVCRRITFMYGQLFEHDQLNRSTHEAIHELFGVTSLSAFDHLGRMVREGHAVGMDGTSYLRDLERLAIPITYIHGDKNHCFLPESTELTVDLLAKTNGKELYRRVTVAGYGDIDCIIGKNAARDVYPLILEHLRTRGAKAQSPELPEMGKRPSPAVL
jgi:cholesterol oxidase